MVAASSVDPQTRRDARRPRRGETPGRKLNAIARYSFAVSLTVLALVARFMLAPQLPQQPFLTFFIAVVLTAFVAGPGPTLTTVVLGYLAADWFFIEPLHHFGPHASGDLARLVTYLAVCGVVIVGSTRISRARDRAEASRTELEREAAERKRTEDALRQSEEMLRLAKDAAGMGAWDWHIDTGKLVWSDRCKALFGLPADTSMANDVFLRAVHPDDRDAIDRAVKDALANRTRCNVEMRVLLPDGSLRWVAWKGEATYARDGRPVRMMGMALDVTDRRRAEEALRETDRRKDEFLGVLSHELRNPLAPIRNSVHVLQRADPTSEQAERARAIIARQVDHLARLVDDLLDVKRISTGKLRLHQAAMDLTQQVRETVEDLRPLFVSRSLSLDLNLPARAVWINGDGTRLAQVVTNLLHNAAKFTDPGGHVAVKVEAGDGRAHIRVRDDGAGVAPDVLDKLFTPFVQSDSTIHRTRGGLGLGLSLVRGVAELHGGTVAARSEGPGKGAEFIVTLPTTEPGLVSTEEPAPRQRTVRCRVLIIEDNADSAESLRDVLVVMGGHEVLVARDGEEGITAAREHAPDVILCDIGLPVLDGYEVARRIRDRIAPAARLVALSGYASPEDVEKAIRAGFDYHLPKPPDLDKVLALVADAPSCATCDPVPDDIRTGHHELDAQHASMLSHWARLRTATKDSVWELLRFLQHHTASHLAYEEEVMVDVGYPDFAVHRARHEQFVEEVRAVQERLERDGATPTNLSAMVDAVEAWVTEHVLDQDRRLAEFIRSRRPEPHGPAGGASTEAHPHLRAV